MEDTLEKIKEFRSAFEESEKMYLEKKGDLTKEAAVVLLEMLYLLSKTCLDAIIDVAEVAEKESKPSTKIAKGIKSPEEILNRLSKEHENHYASFPAFVENELSLDVFELVCEAMNEYHAQFNSIEISPDFIKIVDKYWSFDDNQCHTHTWHDKQDCLKELSDHLIKESLPAEEIKEEVAKFQKGIDERAEDTPVVKAIDEVMTEDRKKDIEMEQFFLSVTKNLVRCGELEAYPNEVFYCKGAEVFIHITDKMYYEKTKSFVFIKIAGFWDVFREKYGLENEETKAFVKTMLEKHLRIDCDPEKVKIAGGLQIPVLI